MPAFWDASAVVPICVPGQPRPGYRRTLREYPQVVWWGTPVEVAGAITRLHRQGHLTASQRDAAKQRLERLRNAWREVQPTERVRDLAEKQLERHELRAPEGLQLAAALVWCRERPKGRSFLCIDLRLKEAARDEGFDVLTI